MLQLVKFLVGRVETDVPLVGPAQELSLMQLRSLRLDLSLVDCEEGTARLTARSGYEFLAVLTTFALTQLWVLKEAPRCRGWPLLFLFVIV